MSNRRFRNEFVNSWQTRLVFLEGRFTVGASGAVTALTTQGTGISSVTKLGAAGTYLIKLEDGYNRLLQFGSHFIAPTTGSAVTAGAFSAGVTYQIVTVGSTDYTLIGARSNAVGVTFVATGVGAGTGTALAVGNSAVVSVEVADPAIDSGLTSALSSAAGIIVQCKSATATVANPTSGSVFCFSLLLRDSAVKGKGE